jgi:hypothetical protein
MLVVPANTQVTLLGGASLLLFFLQALNVIDSIRQAIGITLLGFSFIVRLFFGLSIKLLL